MILAITGIVCLVAAIVILLAALFHLRNAQELLRLSRVLTDQVALEQIEEEGW